MILSSDVLLSRVRIFSFKTQTLDLSKTLELAESGKKTLARLLTINRLLRGEYNAYKLRPYLDTFFKDGPFRVSFFFIVVFSF